MIFCLAAVPVTGSAASCAQTCVNKCPILDAQGGIDPACMLGCFKRCSIWDPNSNGRPEAPAAQPASPEGPAARPPASPVRPNQPSRPTGPEVMR